MVLTPGHAFACNCETCWNANEDRKAKEAKSDAAFGECDFCGTDVVFTYDPITALWQCPVCEAQ